MFEAILPKGGREWTITIFVGLEVHKATIAVAVALSGRSREVRFHGSLPYRSGTMTEFARLLLDKHPDARLSFSYEAGACGYGLARELTDADHERHGCKAIDCPRADPVRQIMGQL